MKQLQWFPGHIARTLNEFKKVHQEIDIFFLVLDARAPKSTLLEQFKDIIRDRKVIVVLTKRDLVTNEDINDWTQKLKKEFEYVVPVNLKEKDKSVSAIEKILEKITVKSLLPKIAILGVPNVGKSTLVNLLTKKSSAKIENRAGVTREKTWFQFKKYWILDSPGILEPQFKTTEIPLTLSLIGSIKIDILPLHQIFEFLHEKSIEFGFENKLEKTNNPNENFYTRQIKNFQTGRLGKIILEK